MADVCQMAPAVLSPISPNESRKRRHGHGYGPGGEDAAPSTWFKRHRTGASFARRLLHLRGFAVDVRRAEDIVRFLDQFPPELDKVRARSPRRAGSLRSWHSFFFYPNFPPARATIPRVARRVPARRTPHPARERPLTIISFPLAPQDVSRILEKCADVDDAEKQLTALRLTFSASGGERGGDAPAAGVEAVASAAAAARDDADARATATATATAAEGGGAANASTSAALKAAGGAADAIGDPADGVVLSGEWVGALVNEMSASADVPDAHERGTRVLRAFETAVRNAVARAAEGGAGRARAPPARGIGERREQRRGASRGAPTRRRRERHLEARVEHPDPARGAAHEGVRDASRADDAAAAEQLLAQRALEGGYAQSRRRLRPPTGRLLKKKAREAEGAPHVPTRNGVLSRT